MSILFYDTETTGLPNFKKPPTDPLQPYIVQLAAILTDNEGNEKASINLIINNNVLIPKEASSVHGLTEKECASYGVPVQFALSIFSGLSRKADIHCGHNLKFDNFFMDVAYQRIGKYSPVQSFDCTMEMATPILNLPPTEKMLRAGFNKSKNPNLSECYKYFFDKELEGAHDALVDVRACKDVYFAIKNGG